MSEEEEVVRADYDGAWKDVLESPLLPYMFEMFFPLLYADVDWSVEPEHLDKELQSIQDDPESDGTERRYVDKLIKVRHKKGHDLFLIIHIEVQVQKDGSFAERMYIYSYRLYERFRKRFGSVFKHPPIHLAILGDDDPNWKPTEFTYEHYYTRQAFAFGCEKLIEWEDRWGELESSDNPFALVVMAHLKTIRTGRRKFEERKRWKYIFLKMALKAGYSRDEISAMFTFVDKIMAIPRALDTALEEEFNRDEEVIEMAKHGGVTELLMERGRQAGLQEGLQKGRQENMIEVARAMLQRGLGLEDIMACTGISLAALEALKESKF